MPQRHTNAKLRKERGIGLEDIAFHIERGHLLDILEHPNPDRYAGHRIFVVQRDHYVYLVPFPHSPASLQRGLRRGRAVALLVEADVEDEHSVFLKTIIPSRKATKQYLGEEPLNRTVTAQVGGLASRPQWLPSG